MEAGNRLGTLSNPEEVNRIVTDRVSSVRLCCTSSAMDFLKKEGLDANSYIVGDPMYDAFKYYSEKVGDKVPEQITGFDDNALLLPDKFYYLTCHRQENTKDDATLTEILGAMECLDYKCVYPVHPRNRDRAERVVKNNNFKNIILCQPVGYLMSVYLTNNCEKIVTDSGGLQREAFFAGKQCVTVFDYVGWPETMVDNRNQLAKPDKTDILKKLSKEQKVTETSVFGDGNSALKIVKYLNESI